MAGIDDIDCSNFFDQIDDLLDIPDETCCTNTNSNAESDFFFDDFKDLPSFWTQSDSDVFHEPTKSVFSENHSNSGSDLSDDLPVPYEEIEQLEWLSNFVEDSFSAGNSLTIDVPNLVPSAVVSPSPTQFQTTSPVSVLESSGCKYGGGKFMPVKHTAAECLPSGGRCGRARSERPRPQTFNRRLVSPCASFTMAGTSLETGNDGYSECESFGELSDSSKIRKSGSKLEHKKKKKKIKLSVPAEANQNENPNSLTTFDSAVRKCQHCEITKTPQWRAGPNGPKTLCNACGVRYKSGRLFPEYRPAASPTFVPTIHSNSHKKVLEMRVKVKTSCDVADSPLIEDSRTETVTHKNLLLLEYM